jgi:hypothetical protein
MERNGGMMATTTQRRSRNVSTFRPDDFVNARQYDKDLERFEEWFREIQKSVKELVPRDEQRIWQQNEARFSRLETKLDIQFDEISKNYTSRREFEERVTRIEGGTSRLIPWIGVGVAILGLMLQGGADALAGVVFLILHLSGG